MILSIGWLVVESYKIVEKHEKMIKNGYSQLIYCLRCY